MFSKTIEFIVGLFVLLGLLALVFLATKVGTVATGDTDSYTLTAKFENIGGLNVKAPVAIGGVRIGRVTAIELDGNDFTAKVTMAVKSEFNELPLDSSASILTSGLLGAQFVGIEPGGDFEFLKNNDEIDLTQSTIQIE
ncbi:MAG: outer membrane lipid asymmetry maintenance protein MlaD, partial [Arenicellales bacterium]